MFSDTLLPRRASAHGALGIRIEVDRVIGDLDANLHRLRPDALA